MYARGRQGILTLLRVERRVAEHVHGSGNRGASAHFCVEEPACPGRGKEGIGSPICDWPRARGDTFFAATECEKDLAADRCRPVSGCCHVTKGLRGRITSETVEPPLEGN